ncbi:MAG: efflux RND transporter periplasmic adaptor subunit [Alistipes sp.]|nr:efflux RND transporter periplasmic adaptor subunit [Alistipes sp.]
MKKIFVYSMFAVAAVAMVSCGSKQSETQIEEVEALPKVEVQSVASRMVSQEAVFTGTVEADVVNNIAPQQPLRIKEIKVDVGDRVKKGQLLVTLDNSSLVQAKAQLDNAKTEYERTNELYEFGGASKSEWDARRMQYEMLQTAYNNLVENTTLISPISGVVTARNYDKGDMYSGAQPVLVIAQIKPVKIMINVSEPFFAKVKKGMQVFVTLDAYGEEVFKGKISRIYPVINQATHTFQVEVTLPNSNERVRPGMFARVTLPYGKVKNVVIPDQAVQKLLGSGDRFVYIYNPADSTVRYSKVELGRRMDAEFEVLSGVKSGEAVVTKGHMGITNGSKVEVVK